MTDKKLREKLVGELCRAETINQRMDIVRERWKEGKCAYIGSREFPGLIIELRPDGGRILGYIENRKFIALEETP